MNRLVVAPILVLALAACGKEADEAPADDRRGAEGEVLGGTISDAMLPLDTVTSQAPPMRESPGPAEAGDSAAAGGGEAGDDPSEAPNAAPSPEPTPEDGD